MNGKLTQYVVTGSLLLTACNPTTPPPPDTSFPKTWTYHLRLGTFNAPAGFNPQVKTPDLLAYATQGWAGQQVNQGTFNLYVDFLEDQKPVQDSVLVYHQGKLVTTLDPGAHWNLQPFSRAALDLSKPQKLDFTLVYKGKTATTQVSLDPASALALPAIQTAELQKQSLKVQWATVPGARSYKVLLDNDQNPDNGVLLEKTVTSAAPLQLPLDAPVNYDTPYQLLVVAYRQLEVDTQVKTEPFNPDFSVVSQTVQVNKPVPTGKLAFFTPAVNTEAKVTRDWWPHLILKAGTAEVPTAYDVKVKTGADFIRVYQATGTLNSGAETRIDLTVSCGEQVEVRHGVLQLTTNDPLHASEDIPVTVNCILPPGTLAHVDTVPEQLLLSDQQASAKFSLQAGDAEVTRVETVLTSGSPFFTLTPQGVVYLQSHHHLNHDVQFDCKGSSGVKKGMIEVRTSDPLRPLTQLPLQLNCLAVPTVETAWQQVDFSRATAGEWNPAGNRLVMHGLYCGSDCGGAGRMVVTDENLKVLGHVETAIGSATPPVWLDDQTVVVGTRDVVQIWNTSTYSQVRQFVSPFQEGTSMLSTAGDGTFVLAGVSATGWQTQRYSQTGQLLNAVAGVSLQAFRTSPLLAGLQKGQQSEDLVLYDTTLKEVDRYALPLLWNGWRQLLGWNQEGTRVLLTEKDSTSDRFLLRVIDGGNDTEQRLTFEQAVDQAKLTGDLLRVVLRDGTVQESKLDGTVVSSQKPLKAFQTRPMRLRWNAAGTRLLATPATEAYCDPGNVLLLTDGQGQLITAVNGDLCGGGRLNLDGKTLVRSSQNHVFRYNLQGQLLSYQPVAGVYPEHMQYAHYDVRGYTIAVDLQGKVKVYKHQTASTVLNVDAFAEGSITHAALSPDLKWLVVYSQQRLRLFNMATGDLVYFANGLLYMQDQLWLPGSKLVYLDGNRSLHVYDPVSKAVQSLDTGLSHPFTKLEVVTADELLVYGTEGVVRVQLSSKTVTPVPVDLHYGYSHDIYLAKPSFDRKYLLLAEGDYVSNAPQSLHVLDYQTGKELKAYLFKDGWNFVDGVSTLDDNGRLLIVTLQDNFRLDAFRLW